MHAERAAFTPFAAADLPKARLISTAMPLAETDTSEGRPTIVAAPRLEVMATYFLVSEDPVPWGALTIARPSVPSVAAKPVKLPVSTPFTLPFTS